MTKYQELIARIGKTEARIIKMVAEKAIGFGWSVSVGDGEEWPLKKSKDLDSIFAEVGHTDETHFQFFREDAVVGSGYEKVGWVWFVHGNDEDVVTDYTDNERINELMVGVY